MPTLHQHRLVVVVPAARVPAFGTWWQANIDPTDNCSTWPELNATGADVVGTHRWCSVALQDAQLKAVLARACSIASITPATAGQWNGWTRAQKKVWLDGVRDALFTASGIWLDLCPQDGGAWTDPEAALTRVGVKRRARAMA